MQSFFFRWRDRGGRLAIFICGDARAKNGSASGESCLAAHNASRKMTKRSSSMTFEIPVELREDEIVRGFAISSAVAPTVLPMFMAPPYWKTALESSEEFIS